MFRNATILIEPMFSKTPKTLNPIYVVSTFWNSFVFCYNDMVSSYVQRTVSMPVVSVIKTSLFDMFINYWQKNFSASGRNWEGQNSSISLIQSKNHMFSRRTPTPFTTSFATKHCFINFYLTTKRRFFYFFDCVSIYCLANYCINLLERFQRYFCVIPNSLYAGTPSTNK